MWVFDEIIETYPNVSGAWYARVSLGSECRFLKFPSEPSTQEITAAAEELAAALNAMAEHVPSEHDPLVRELT